MILRTTKVKLFEFGIVALAMLAALLQANANRVAMRASVETGYAASLVILGGWEQRKREPV